MKTRSRKTPGVYVTESDAPAERGEWHGPALVDGQVHLSPADLTRLDLLQTKAELAQAKFRIGESERRLAEAQWAEAQRRFQATMKTLDDAVRSASTKLAESRVSLAAAYGFDWAKASFDDETGQVFVDGLPLRGE